MGFLRRCIAVCFASTLIIAVAPSTAALAVPPQPILNGAGATAIAFRYGVDLWFAYNLDSDPIGSWTTSDVPGPGAYSDPTIAPRR
ncbi:hypothetical protein GCM10020216_108810 [Nonomuraea helvata]